MTFLDAVSIIVGVAVVVCMICFGLRLAQTRDNLQRARVRKTMVRTLSGLLVVLTVGLLFTAFDPVAVEARSESRSFVAQRVPANYKLAVSVFEYSDSPYVLILNYKGSEVISIVEWDITALPSEVSFASISRVNGQDRLTYAGIPPSVSYDFYLNATVWEANRIVISVPLVIRIFNGR